MSEENLKRLTPNKHLKLIPQPTEFSDTNDAMIRFEKPAQVLQRAKEAAQALESVIKNKRRPVIFNGEQYLEFEDWQTVARFYKLAVKIISTNVVEFGGIKGFEARASVIDLETGAEVSSADSMCLQDEKNWSFKPLFQLRSMAQTRACAKALRNVLAWVVVLAGFKPTPAEEMENVHPVSKKDNVMLVRSVECVEDELPRTETSVKLISPMQQQNIRAIAKSAKMDDVALMDLLTELGYKEIAKINAKHFPIICKRIVESFQNKKDES